MHIKAYIFSTVLKLELKSKAYKTITNE